MALTSALGALLGYAGNTTAARTGTTTSTTASSSTPSFTPGQTQLQNTVGETLEGRLQNGYDITPSLTSGNDQINKTYKGAGDALTQSLAARGFGKSGAVGTGMEQIEAAKAGSVGNLTSNLETYANDQNNKTLEDAEKFAFSDPGSSSTSSSAGTQTGAGSALAGGLSGGFTAYLAQLNQLAASGGK